MASISRGQVAAGEFFVVSVLQPGGAVEEAGAEDVRAEHAHLVVGESGKMRAPVGLLVGVEDVAIEDADGVQVEGAGDHHAMLGADSPDAGGLHLIGGDVRGNAGGAQDGLHSSEVRRRIDTEGAGAGGFFEPLGGWAGLGFEVVLIEGGIRFFEFIWRLGCDRLLMGLLYGYTVGILTRGFATGDLLVVHTAGGFDEVGSIQGEEGRVRKHAVVTAEIFSVYAHAVQLYRFAFKTTVTTPGRNSKRSM